MTSLTDMPADIVRDAQAALAWQGKPDDVLYVAKAIFSERQRSAAIAQQYAQSYENGLCHYGDADKDAGRGRQEGHIKAGRDIHDAIIKGEGA